jgi:hypothetical protein
MAKTRGEPNPEQEKNMSVRLDAETKELIQLVGMALDMKEKDIAIEAIQLYCRDKLDAVAAKLNDLKKRYDIKARGK